MLETDEQRQLWYRLRGLLDSPAINLRELQRLGQMITDFDYFDDLFDLLLNVHAGHRRWTRSVIYQSLNLAIEPYQKARYQTVLVATIN